MLAIITREEILDTQDQGATMESVVDNLRTALLKNLINLLKSWNSYDCSKSQITSGLNIFT